MSGDFNGKCMLHYKRCIVYHAKHKNDASRSIYQVCGVIRKDVVTVPENYRVALRWNVDVFFDVIEDL